MPNIVITPQANTPTIAFTDGSSNTITLEVANNNGLSFQGSTGELFSITDSLSGTLYAVNDISGIPSLEILDSGQIKIAETNGWLSVGTNKALYFPLYESAIFDMGIHIENRSDGYSRIYFGGDGGASNQGGLFRWQDSANAFTWYNNSGNAFTLTMTLTNAGNLTIPGTFTESSSLRYKENVRDLEDSSFLYNLRPVVYDKKDGNAKDEFGFIAEEVNDIVPNVVTKIEEQADSISYQRLVPALVKEIQNLKKEITQLKEASNGNF